MGRKMTVLAASVVSAIAGLAIGLAGTAAAAPAVAARHHQPVCRVDGIPNPATRHVIPRGDSLAGWASRHGTYPGNVVGLTAECGPGWQQLAMLRYVNAGNWRHKFPRAVTVWAFPWHK